MPEEEDYSDLDSMDLDDIPTNKHTELWGCILNYLTLSTDLIAETFSWQPWCLFVCLKIALCLLNGFILTGICCKLENATLENIGVVFIIAITDVARL